MELESQENEQSYELPTLKKPVAKRENLPWVEKYRPAKLIELISHDSIIQTLERFVEEKKLPNLLFYGPPGTGKTSTVVACAKQLYGPSLYNSMVLELNASDERGINVVRETIKTFVSTQNIGVFNDQKMVKLVILDEADAMTSAAQFALRRIIEKYAKNARFCLICNLVSKIIPALQSRCTRFKFKHIPFPDAIKKVKLIASQEKMNLTEEALEALYRLCEGDMRKIVNMLQSIHISFGSGPKDELVDSNYIYKLTANASPLDIESIFSLLLNEDLSKAFEKIEMIKIEKGLSMQILLKELNLILMKTEWAQESKIFLIKRLCELEYRMSIGCSEKIQLGALVGGFNEVRHLKE